MSDTPQKNEQQDSYSSSAILKACIRVIRYTSNDPTLPESMRRQSRDTIFKLLKELGIESFRKT